MASLSALARSSPIASRPCSRRRTAIVCLGTSPAPVAGQPATRGATSTAASGLAALQMPSPFKPSSWMGVLDLYFMPRSGSQTWESISDVNTSDDHDDHAAHMYTSHLANRLATQPIGGDESS